MGYRIAGGPLCAVERHHLKDEFAASNNWESATSWRNPYIAISFYRQAQAAGLQTIYICIFTMHQSSSHEMWDMVCMNGDNETPVSYTGLIRLNGGI